ncbi:MAG TPA: aminotransferase class V-fold PLP-dependent enzyme, partial [Candidatus Acetothermia bacterium]|nr:aminotransferase class V-fold PLP-dependent enzyme [Candidatus Acetothermia bacterium]
MNFSSILYFDHQASTPVDQRVFQKMSPFFTEMVGNPHSSDHALGWEMSGVVEAAKTSVAGLIGAETDEIVFTSGASESNNLAILGLGRRAAGGKRRRILVSAIEHKCVLAA